MVEIERRVDLLGKPRARIVGDALVVLFKDHLELRLHLLVGEHQLGHPVGLELHHRLEVLAGDALEVAGVVLRGEGVLLAADRGDLLGEAARRVLGGALEQQVLEEMREAGLAGRLVGGADLVPDHVGDDRRAPVRDHDHFEAVGQREVADVGLGLGLGSAARAWRWRRRR